MSLCFCMLFWIASKTAQEAPKRPQDPPKSASRGSKRPPRVPQEAQRGAQQTPGTGQECSRPSKITPKDSKRILSARQLRISVLRQQLLSLAASECPSIKNRKQLHTACEDKKFISKPIGRIEGQSAAQHAGGVANRGSIASG